MMRYIMSYGVALVLILLIAGWLASGTLIEGGKGAGNGETAIINLIEPNDNGPVRRLFTAIGLIKPGQPEQGDGKDAAQNSASTLEPTPAAQKLQTVLFEKFSAQMMPIEVKVRGQTEASAKISVRAQTGGIVKQIDVSKGQHVEPGFALFLREVHFDEVEETVIFPKWLIREANKISSLLAGTRGNSGT